MTSGRGRVVGLLEDGEWRIGWGVMDERGRPQTLGCRPWGRVIVLLAAWAGVSGCLGPNAVRYTRLRYNDVVRDTNDQQLLMNIVRLRYADSPVFIDLPNITSQFELAAGGSDPGPAGSQTNFGVGGVWGRDTPTLSYHPREGREIAQVAAEPDHARPVQRGQRRRHDRAAPAADRQRHQRRAQCRPGHDPDAQGGRRQHRVRPRHQDPGRPPGSRSDRIGGRDQGGGRGRLRADLEGLGRGPRPARGRQGGLRLPCARGWPGDAAQAGEGAVPQDPSRVYPFPRDGGSPADLQARPGPEQVPDQVGADRGGQRESRRLRWKTTRST